MAQSIAKPQPTSKQPETHLADSPIIVEARNLLGQMKQVTEAIAKRAYEFFEQGGRQAGREIDDWFHAELELLRPLVVEIGEGDRELTIRAEVPGFTAKDIQVSVEPTRVIISGKTETSDEKKIDGVAATEGQSNEIFRALDLPTDVDPTRVTATVKDGILLLSLAKATIVEPLKVEVKQG